MKTSGRLVYFCLLVAITTAGLVKRDTADDLQETLGNFGESIQSEVNNLQNGGVLEEINKRCVRDSSCMEPFQFCDNDITKKSFTDLKEVNGFRCTFHVWVYVALGVFCVVLLLVLCASCACCPCCCLYSICRKK